VLTPGESLERPSRLTFVQNWLLGEPLRLAFWRRSEMDGGQKSTDQHHQQIDFHFVLRSPLQALTERNAKRVPSGSMTLV
jgi:hypothetical protein